MKESIFSPYRGRAPEKLSEYINSLYAGGRLLCLPPMRGMYRDKGVSTVVMHRHGQLQTEMIIVDPDYHIAPHKHPGVHSAEIGWCGGIELVVDGVSLSLNRDPRSDGISRNFCKWVYIPDDAEHWGISGPEGAVFLSAQLWSDNMQVTRIGSVWQTLGK